MDLSDSMFDQDHPDSSTASESDVISSSNLQTDKNQLLKQLLLQPECAESSHRGANVELAAQVVDVDMRERAVSVEEIEWAVGVERSERVGNCETDYSTGIEMKSNVRRRNNASFSNGVSRIRPATTSSFSSNVISVRPGITASFSSNILSARPGTTASAGNNISSARSGTTASFSSSATRVSAVSAAAAGMTSCASPGNTTNLGYSEMSTMLSNKLTNSFHQTPGNLSVSCSSTAFTADSCFDDLFINLPSVDDDKLLLDHIEHVLMSSELSLEDLESLLPSNTLNDVMNDQNQTDGRTGPVTLQGLNIHDVMNDENQTVGCTGPVTVQGLNTHRGT